MTNHDVYGYSTEAARKDFAVVLDAMVRTRSPIPIYYGASWNTPREEDRVAMLVPIARFNELVAHEAANAPTALDPQAVPA